MATFLDEPDIRSLRPQRGSQGSPEADAVSGLAGVIDYVGSKVKQKRADQAVVEKGQAIGDATTSLLDLKDERANLLDEESSFRDSVSNIYADGIVTEEEKATLDSMSDQKSKLERARKSGVLNETAYNTRYNAMWKQNLSNVSNLALQGEINSIFGSGIATFQEPVNTQEAQISAQLDQQYGKGKWGVQEQGQMLGNQAFVQQKIAQGSASITKLQGNISNLSSAINSTSVNAMLTAVKQNGGVLTDVTKNNYLLAAQSSLSQMEGLFNKRVADARANGERLDSATLEKMQTDLDDERKYYLETLPTQMETFGAGTQLEKAMKLKQTLIDLNKPMAASANAAFTGGGDSGVGGQITAEKMLDPAFVKNLESLQSGLPIEMMQQAAVDQLVWQFTGDVSVADMVDKGLVNPELLVLTGSIALDNATVTDTPSFDASLMEVDKYRAGVNLQDSGKFIASIDSFTGKARQLSVIAKSENGNEKAVKGQVGQVLRAQLARVVTGSRREDINITIGEDGIPVVQQIRFSKGIASRGQAVGLSRMEKEVEALVKAYTEYARFGLADIKDLSELALVPTEPEAVKVQSTSPISRAAKARRQEEQPDVSGLEDGVYEDDQGNQFTVVGGAIQ
jgi:hypothetical protein